MKKQDYLQEYETTCYSKAAEEFITKSMEYISANNEEIALRLTGELEEFIHKIAKMQMVQKIPAGQIAISVLRTGIWEGKPRLRFDCYDEGKEAGRNLAYQYMDADFLTVEWENFRNNLEQMAKEGGYERYVKTAQLEQYMSRTIERLIVLFVMNFKYYLADADYLKHFDEMLKAEVFLLTAGEYMDWQKILYASVPEIDIIANPNEQPLIFQKINDKIYRHRQFEDMDLTQARFRECEFSKCSFENVILNDTRFENCLFRDVEMLSGSMYGATFTDCVFQNVDMDGMQKEWKPDVTQPVRLKEIYREVRYIGCIMDGHRIG